MNVCVFAIPIILHCLPVKAVLFRCIQKLKKSIKPEAESLFIVVFYITASPTHFLVYKTNLLRN